MEPVVPTPTPKDRSTLGAGDGGQRAESAEALQRAGTRQRGRGRGWLLRELRDLEGPCGRAGQGKVGRRRVQAASDCTSQLTWK